MTTAEIKALAKSVEQDAQTKGLFHLKPPVEVVHGRLHKTCLVSAVGAVPNRPYMGHNNIFVETIGGRVDRNWYKAQDFNRPR